MCRYLNVFIFENVGDVTINIEPKEDYKSSGINDVAEFHCRVTGLKNGGKGVSFQLSLFNDISLIKIKIGFSPIGTVDIHS